MRSDRTREILTLGMSIMGAMVSQSILNLVDAAMVGVLGETALAGVGIGSYANFMAVAIVIGLSTGVQAMVARRKGEGRMERAAVPLNGGLLLAVLLGVPLTIAFLFFAPEVLAILNNDPEVREVAVPYFQARILAVLAIGFNFSFRGYWNGINQSGTYMRTLVIMHVCNVAISYCLIFGKLGLPEMGATGAGLGTSISLYIGTLIYLFLTLRHGRAHGFLHGFPDRETMRTMVRLSVPNSLQQLFFAAGITALFWIIGLVGTEELAVGHVLISLVLFLILPAIGLGIAATSLVSQALGRGDPEDAYRWGWDVYKVTFIMLVLLGMPMWIAPDLVLSLFVHEPELLDLGRLPLRITGFGICIDALSIVMMQSLLGAGANRAVLGVSLFTQWVIFLPVAYLIGPVLGWGLLAIWLAQIGQRAISGGIFAWLWHKREWVHIRI